jgi:hypothetical protein
LNRFPVLHAKASSQLAQAERAILLACEETCERMCELGCVDVRLPQELFVMQRYSVHIESILGFLQAKDSSAGFLKKNGGKCMDAALLLSDWYRLVCKPSRAGAINDIIAAMWGVLSDAQMNTFGAQCARWLRSSLQTLSSSECHKWFAIIRSISGASARHLTACQVMCELPHRIPPICPDFKLTACILQVGSRRPHVCRARRLHLLRSRASRQRAAKWFYAVSKKL